MKVEQKAVKDYMNQKGWTYLNRSIPFREVRMMLTEFAEQQVKLLATPAVVGQSEQLVCEHKYQDNVCDWRGVRKCIICGQMEKAN